MNLFFFVVGVLVFFLRLVVKVDVSLIVGVKEVVVLILIQVVLFVKERIDARPCRWGTWGRRVTKVYRCLGKEGGKRESWYRGCICKVLRWGVPCSEVPCKDWGPKEIGTIS
jgi:hypothetical protein